MQAANAYTRDGSEGPVESDGTTRVDPGSILEHVTATQHGDSCQREWKATCSVKVRSTLQCQESEIFRLKSAARSDGGVLDLRLPIVSAQGFGISACKLALGE